MTGTAPKDSGKSIRALYRTGCCGAWVIAAAIGLACSWLISAEPAFAAPGGQPSAPAQHPAYLPIATLLVIVAGACFLAITGRLLGRMTELIVELTAQLLRATIQLIGIAAMLLLTAFLAIRAGVAG